MASNVRIADGSMDFSAGVDASKVSTISSELTTNGIKRNQLPWLINGTVRGGGITQRMGWQPLCTVHPGASLYQGGWLYDNSLQGGFPYLMLSIGGEMIQVRVDTDNSVVNISTQFGLSDPADVQQAYFTQGEEFMVKQAGDGSTLPLFWDGITLRRSNGLDVIVGTVAAPAFTAPPVYQNTASYVLIPLDASGYEGQTNQHFFVNGDNTREYMHILPGNRIVMNNLFSVPVGTVIPAGSKIYRFAAPGEFLGTLLLDYTVGVIGPNDAAYMTPALPGGSALQIMVAGYHMYIDGSGLPAPAANEIYAVNINDISGALYLAGDTLESQRELPAATCMDYFMGRIWYAQDRTYTAGDIVGGDAGTSGTRKRDSILKVTENPLALAGDGFIVPTSAGLIRALRHTANLNSANGEGQLYVFTRKAVYSLNVPVTRAEWVNSKEPLQRVALITQGAYGDRSIVNVNGDLFYQSPDGIRSLFISIRNFDTWGNTPISNNIERLLQFNDRSMMRYASGIQFDNRMIQAELPYQTDVGPAFQAMAVLDFDLISALDKKLPPAWEGMWQGLDVLQIFEGDYGGLQRAFAVVRSKADGSIQVWELTSQNRFENGDQRVTWVIETPAWTWGREMELKKLDGLECWIDRVFGTVEMTFYYRPDASTCWNLWSIATFCAARSSAEDVINPTTYPEQPYCEGFRFPITLPTPPLPDCDGMNARPLNLGYSFQVKMEIKGFCRIRGLIVFAVPAQKAPFLNQSCP